MDSSYSMYPDALSVSLRCTTLRSSSERILAISPFSSRAFTLAVTDGLLIPAFWAIEDTVHSSSAAIIPRYRRSLKDRPGENAESPSRSIASVW